MKKSVISGIIILIFTTFLYSDVYKDAGSSSAQFLKIKPSAAGSGSAGAFTAESGIGDSIFYNAAGISTIKDKEVLATYSLWYEDVSFLNLTFCMNIPNFFLSGVGIGTTLLSYGDIPVLTI